MDWNGVWCGRGGYGAFRVFCVYTPLWIGTAWVVPFLVDKIGLDLNVGSGWKLAQPLENTAFLNFNGIVTEIIVMLIQAMEDIQRNAWRQLKTD